MKMLKHEMQLLFMPLSYGLFPLKIAQKKDQANEFKNIIQANIWQAQVCYVQGRR
jgi:hypothetical protein